MASIFKRILTSALLLGCATAAQASVTKLDPALQRAWQHSDVKASTAKAAQKQPYVSALLQLVDVADAQAVEQGLQSMGVQVRSRTGSVMSVQVPRSALAKVAALAEVKRLEGARPLPQRLFKSVAATGATSLRTQTPPQWQGLTGKGVIVGVVDDGFDFLHPSLRHADGSTRILALWDQLDSAAGSPPSGFNYGGVCTATMINQAIAQAEANETVTACTQPSDGGHGTHVASIAAGNGADTQEAYQHVGMAPEADLVVVNGINSDLNVEMGTDTVIDGIAFIRDQAKLHGKKAVVNLSLGSYYGARDGTSVFEQALDSFVDNDGLLIVAAVGNEGDARIRTSGTIAPGGSDTIELEVPEGLTQGSIEVWYSGDSRYAISLTGPSGCGTTPTLEAPVSGNITEWYEETACGYIDMYATAVNPDNGDRMIRAYLLEGDSQPLVTGTWRLTLSAPDAGRGQPTSEYNMITAENMGDIAVLDRDPADGITRQILTDTASATQVIGVASYNTNYVWDGQDGTYDADLDGYGFGALDDISNFSSRGPRRSCSDSSKCPNVMKPEITAPGAYIMAAKAHDYEHPYTEETSSSGNYVTFYGTSMATPHVAGAIALLWQSFPEESALQIRARLLGNTKTTAHTPAQLPTFSSDNNQPAQPDYTWGYGVLAVDQAVNASEPDVGTEEPGTEEPGTDTPGTENPDTEEPSTEEPARSGGSGGGGCSLASGATALDPTLPVLLILAAFALLRPRREGVL